MGRETDRLLAALSGERWYPYGEGDDNSGLEVDFENWAQDLEVKYIEAAANISSPL